MVMATQNELIELNTLARNFANGFKKLTKEFDVEIPSITSNCVRIKSFDGRSAILVYIYSKTEVVLITPGRKMVAPSFQGLPDLLSQVIKICRAELSYF